MKSLAGERPSVDSGDGSLGASGDGRTRRAEDHTSLTQGDARIGISGQSELKCLDKVRPVNAMNSAGSGFCASGQNRTAVIESKIMASAALTAVNAQPADFEAALSTPATAGQDDARGHEQAVSKER